MNRIVILGGGESGTGSAVLSKVKGFDTFLSDFGSIDSKYKSILKDYGIPYEEGGHSKERILNADEIIKSPGIPESAPIIQEIRAAGIHIISEIEFAGRYDNARKICITGSNGKTTTTSLIYHLLKGAGLNVGLGGNIGDSYAYQVATQDHDVYVLELSSFQLDGMYDFKADIAILMNITPDHLDRYEYKMINYIRSKFRITQNMTEKDSFIYCLDDPTTMEHLHDQNLSARLFPFSQEKENAEGAFMQERMINVRIGERNFRISAEDLQIKGRHNIYNSMAAALAARIMGLTDREISEGLKSFENIEHRMEKVREIGGVLFINDSKATNVNSTWYALECMDRPVVWIAGGKDKGNDYSEIYDLVKDKVKALVCMGIDNRKLHEDFEDKVSKIVDTDSAAEAVRQAYALAEEGDTVLLSPCCASFDLFKSYEDRGRQFKAAVKAL